MPLALWGIIELYSLIIGTKNRTVTVTITKVHRYWVGTDKKYKIVIKHTQNIRIKKRITKFH